MPIENVGPGGVRRRGGVVTNDPLNDVFPAFIDADDGAGNTVLVGADGQQISLGAKATTLVTSVVAVFAQDNTTPINFTGIGLDENGTGDTTNNRIGIPVGATFAQFSAVARFNNSGSTTGVMRELYIIGITASGTTVLIPGGRVVMPYTSGSTADITCTINTPKMSISYIETLLGIDPDGTNDPLVYFQLVANHDSSVNLGLVGISEPFTTTAIFSLNF